MRTLNWDNENSINTLKLMITDPSTVLFVQHKILTGNLLILLLIITIFHMACIVLFMLWPFKYTRL